MANVATVSLEELRQAGRNIEQAAQALEQARSTYGDRLGAIQAAVVEVAPGYEVTVRF